MRTRIKVAAALVTVAGLVLAGCGDGDEKVTAGGSAESSSPAPDGSWADQPWLLGFNTAGGAEGETVRAVYVRFTPSTGATTVRELPGLTTRDTYADGQALLVSADLRYALLDSRVTAADRRAGRITLYPLEGTGTVRLEVRAWSKAAGMQPVAAAFDPADGGVLRVVDSLRRVWRVDLVARTAVDAGDLPTRVGWIYANGFDKNTGLPYIEATDSTDTLPPGNGDDDTRPLERRGGVIHLTQGEEPSGTPALPCGFAGGFTVTDGTAWLFCADTPKIAAYRLQKGSDAWERVGVDSKPVVPATAEELPVVLPPVVSGP